MLCSVIMFAMMDATVKWLGSSYPTHQIMFFRCTVALVPVMVILFMQGGLSLLKTGQPNWHLLRSLLGVTAMGLAFYAFSLMRLADAIALLHTTPLFMTALSVLILRERVGLHRWSAVVIGFIGMLIVIKPGSGMLDSGSLYMLFAAFLIGCTTIIVRHLSLKDDAICITFYFTVFGVVVSSSGLLLFGWQTPPAIDWLFFILIGLLGGLAQYLMTVSYRNVEIAIVSPLKYLTIVFGGLVAYVIWSEVPDRQSQLGIAIIVVSGLYTLRRELLLSNRTSP